MQRTSTISVDTLCPSQGQGCAETGVHLHVQAVLLGCHTAEVVQLALHGTHVHTGQPQHAQEPPQDVQQHCHAQIPRCPSWHTCSAHQSPLAPDNLRGSLQGSSRCEKHQLMPWLLSEVQSPFSSRPLARLEDSTKQDELLCQALMSGHRTQHRWGDIHTSCHTKGCDLGAAHLCPT